MTRIPEPAPGPTGPTFENRPLARADAEVVDQGAAFDLGTLLTRRSLLSVIGIGAGAIVLAACAPGSSGDPAPSATTPGGSGSGSGSGSGEIPDETAGPYPGDGSNGPDALSQSGIVRSDIRSDLDGGTTAEGVLVTLVLTVLDMANGDRPFEGAAVYVWHCDAQGGYSMYSRGIENATYLRGVQSVDATGTVTFTSVFPGCYPGRWPHIHFEVYPDLEAIADHTSAIAISQLALPADASDLVYASTLYSGSSENLAQLSLESDNVFGDDGGKSQLATLSGDVDRGYRVELTVRVDTRTTPSTASAPSGPVPPSRGQGLGGPGGVVR